MLRQVAAPLLGMALTLTACSVNGSRGASSGRPPTSAGGTAAAAAPSAGCTRTPTAAGGRYRFGGRSYLLTLPRSRGRTPVPLVLDLHGLRSNGFQEAVYSRVASLGAARGFAVVEPNGATRPRGWRLPGMADGTADVRYIRGLLDHLESTLCVDTGREFATGFSNGAGMSAALVCGLGGRLAAVAPVAGLNLTRPCADPRPTTMLVFHGTADPIIPYGGGARTTATWRASRAGCARRAAVRSSCRPCATRSNAGRGCSVADAPPGGRRPRASPWSAAPDAGTAPGWTSTPSPAAATAGRAPPR
ncbi:alpha/beta hydrolase family esterase [Actinomadura keratinilytica]|uniref:alpha/beta hydrolase family esterase n=1 Tax=Actinomadura keratinilytica TaxID=547461 RepID=UPI00361D499A